MLFYWYMRISGISCALPQYIINCQQNLIPCVKSTIGIIKLNGMFNKLVGGEIRVMKFK